MNALKLIGLPLIQLLKQAWSLPKASSNAIKQKQQRTILDGLEAEWLGGFATRQKTSESDLYSRPGFRPRNQGCYQH